MFNVVHDTPETIRKRNEKIHRMQKKQKLEDEDEKMKQIIGEEIEQRRKQIDVLLNADNGFFFVSITIQILFLHRWFLLLLFFFRDGRRFHLCF